MMKFVQNHRGGVVDRRDPQGTRARIPNAPGHCGCPTKAPTHGFARGQPCAQSGQRVLLPPATAVAGPILEKGIRNLSRVLEGSTLSPAHGAPHIDELAKFPSQVRPYAALARLDKPIGTWLLLWPCFWSIALAAPAGSLPDVGLLISFGIGATVLRGAGCTINDLCDRDLDGSVERTRSRPLAAGDVSVAQAIAFLALQTAVGVGWMASLNPSALQLGLSSLGLVAAYPLMKRITDWPQLFLGFTFNWGAMMGWAAVHGDCDWNVVGPLYVAGIFWTLVYDTIYANQDKEDDREIGVRSSALALGSANRAAMSAFAAASVAGLAATGVMAGCSGPYFGGVAAAGAHLAWQLGTVDLGDRADCGDKFRSNTWVGAAVFAGIVLDRLAIF